jgi:hypothetical protein
VRIDWHGYAPDQVATWADRVIEAAFKHGFRYVEFVHGAADVGARGTPGYEAPGERRGSPARGRGEIKKLLRQRLYGGQWRAWAQDRREGNHRVLEGSMSIALLENPLPDPAARWPILPPPAY